MLISDGLVVEKEIAKSINNKKYIELSNNMKHLVKRLFPEIKDEDVLYCERYGDVFKSDIYIRCNGQTRNVSVKTGRSNILHNEILTKFIEYLRENNISEKTLETIMLFHYGDGTTDGTGSKRMNYNQVMTFYGEQIAEANYELNTDRDFVVKTVNRIMFDGAFDHYVKADSIYSGNIDYGEVATKKQVDKHVKRKYCSYYKNPHIGPILFRPDSRYVDMEILDERKRNRIVAYWPSLKSDIEYIASRYDD